MHVLDFNSINYYTFLIHLGICFNFFLATSYCSFFALGLNVSALFVGSKVKKCLLVFSDSQILIDA